MKLPRRQFLQLAVAAAAFPTMSRVAWAQAYPTRPVRIIVGFAAGGLNDIIAHLVGQWLSERLGKPFIIENRPGSGGNIAVEAVVNAPPDGYTLLMVSTPNAVNATSDTPIRNITPVAGIMRMPNVMTVSPSLPVKTVPEFIAYAKARPGKINMGSAGVAIHLAGELFKMMTGVNMAHVPHRASAAMFTGLFAGQTQVAFDSLPPSMEYIRTKKLRALAVTTGKRSDALPDHRRFCTGIRGECLVWGWGAARYARRNYRRAEQGDQCRPCAPYPEGTLFQSWRKRVFQLARRVRKVHRRRNGEVGQGGKVRGHEAGVIRINSSTII
jgi:tripartite-type tricarboxylate transporter receptor subunit TctC